MEYYCPNCDKTYDEDELKIIWGNNHCGDEMVCPDCGEFERLEELEEK